MAKSEERIKAYALRREGKSVKEIAKALDVSRGSVSVWVRDIMLTSSQKEQLRKRQIAAGHKGRVLGAEMNRANKLSRLLHAKEEAERNLSALSKNQLYFLGLGLYWGEGTKSRNSALSVANSDPEVILLMKKWFMECFDVEDSRFVPRVFISDTHRYREQVIIGFWAELLGLPVSQFRKTVFLDKGKKIYENHDVYYGVLAFGVSKGGDIRNRILAQIHRVAELNTKPV